MIWWSARFPVIRETRPCWMPRRAPTAVRRIPGSSLPGNSSAIRTITCGAGSHAGMASRSHLRGSLCLLRIGIRFGRYNCSGRRLQRRRTMGGDRIFGRIWHRFSRMMPRGNFRRSRQRGNSPSGVSPARMAALRARRGTGMLRCSIRLPIPGMRRKTMANAGALQWPRGAGSNPMRRSSRCLSARGSHSPSLVWRRSPPTDGGGSRILIARRESWKWTRWPKTNVLQKHRMACGGSSCRSTSISSHSIDRSLSKATTPVTR